jgi:probable lipoprotein NlpC
MKHIIIILLLSLFVTSCGSSKSKFVTTKKNDSRSSKKVIIAKKEPEINTPNNLPLPKSSDPLVYTKEDYELISKIIDNAKDYLGTRYKTGGTTKSGMDCSGLVSTAFAEEDVNLPRISRDMALEGEWVDIKDVREGDLVFFATRKNSRVINHVGIVTDSRVGYVKFIHSSSSLGVIESELSEKYWYFAFVQARRVI